MKNFFLPLLLFTTALPAQTCRLVKDINPNGDGSAITWTDEWAVAGDHLFFTAAECWQSAEVYAVSAAEDSIYLPRNIWQEGNDTWCTSDPFYWFENPDELTPVGDQLYYIIYQQDFGREVWKTDGTTTGTQLMGDIAPGDDSSLPGELTAFQNKIWFAATDPFHGRELWFADGTANSAQLIADLAPGNSSAFPTQLCVLDDYLYFIIHPDGQDYYLWRTDGSAAGTVPLMSIAVDSLPGAQPVDLQASGELLFLTLWDDASNISVLLAIYPPTWVIVGLGTYITDYNYSEYLPSQVTAVANKRYFSAITAGTGRELWTTDGTAAGTQLVADLRAGNQGSNPDHLTEHNGALFFIGETDDGERLFQTTADSLEMLDLTTVANFQGFGNLFSWNGWLWFTAHSDHPSELWRSDGSSQGTTKILDGFPNTPYIELTKVFNNALYFFGNKNGVRSIWKTNGEPGSTPQLLKGATAMADDAYPGLFVPLRNQVYFWASSNNDTRQIWRSQGLGANTIPVTDLAITFPYGNTWGPFPIEDSLLIFSAFTWATGNELWKTNGIPQTEQIILDLNPGSNGAISQFAGSDGRFFYFTTDASSGNLPPGLWQTDGTEAGTFLLMPEAGWVSEFVCLQDYTFTTAIFQGNRWLLKTNGTLTGTDWIASIDIGPVNAYDSYLTALNDKIYFFRNLSNQNWELWATDGSFSGTEFIAVLNPVGMGRPFAMKATEDLIYFGAFDSVHGYELWTSDGTPAGTHLLKDLSSAPGENSYTSPSIALGDKMLFTFHTTEFGEEIGISDGSPEGTHLLKDILDGPASSNPFLFQAAVLDSLVFFSAFTEETGRELWQTDGTPEGTVLVQDICPGPCSSAPQHLLAVAGHRLFFSAYSPETGRETWIYDPLNTSSVKQEPSLSLDFMLFPNPVNDGVINLQWSEFPDCATYSIYNAQGGWMLSKSLPKSESSLRISLPELSNGLYFMQLKSEDGRLQKSKSFAVMRG